MAFIEKPIEKSELSKIAKERFGDLVKAVIDIERGIMEEANYTRTKSPFY